MIPRTQFRCPRCKEDELNFRHLKYDILPFTIQKKKKKTLEFYYSPSKPLELAWEECLQKNFMVVSRVFSIDILRKLTHGPIEKKTSSGRHVTEWKGVLEEFEQRIQQSCHNLILRGGRYDLQLPDYVVDSLQLEILLEPILSKLRFIMGTPSPRLRTHNVIFVPTGTPPQSWHVDDVKVHVSKPRYFTILIHLNPIDAECGGTEIWEKSSKTYDLIRGRPGDAFVFSGSLEHRGQANQGSSHRFFYYASFACREDKNTLM